MPESSFMAPFEEPTQAIMKGVTTIAPETSNAFYQYDEIPVEGNDVYYANEDAYDPYQDYTISEFEKELIKMSFYAGYIYVLLAVTGILLNAYVIARLIQLAVRDYERFKHGCGLPLAAMSSSDMSCLISITCAVVLGGLLPESAVSITAHTAHCKITMYLIHSLTGFSTWCWLFISALRYIAVYHPLWHIKGSVLGTKAVALMMLFVLLFNSWLLIVVNYSAETRECVEQPLSIGAEWNRVFHCAELFWSYILPAVLTLALDIRVILVRPPSFSKMAKRSQKRKRVPLRTTLNDGLSQAEMQIKGCFCWCGPQVSKTPRISVVTDEEDSKLSGEIQTRLINLIGNVGRARTLTNSTYNISSSYSTANSSRNSPSGMQKSIAYKQRSWQSTCSHTTGSTKRSRKTVRRWLAITTVHLFLNAPDSMYRLVNMIDNRPPVDSPTSHLIMAVVRLLYFAQFCFNAAFLSAIVYRRNIRPKPRQTTPKQSTTYLRVHPEYSRPQTRCGVSGESRRSSMRHQMLKRRYSADPRAMRERAQQGHTFLDVNKLSLTAPMVPSYSTETFRSEELDLNSSPGSATVQTSPRSPSTEPRNDIIIRPASNASSGRTSAGLVTYASTEDGFNVDLPECSHNTNANSQWNRKAAERTKSCRV